MPDLQRLFRREQPVFTALLREHVAAMPPLARPVATHVLAAGGKRLRPLLTLLVGRSLGSRRQDLYLLGTAVEMLHAASLLHDDILDNALLRRGRPAAHTLFGVPPVILAGDAMLGKALLLVSSLQDPRLTACVAEAVMHTAEGEIDEYANLRNPDLSQDEYLRIITGKTAWVLRASCELGALSAKGGEDSVAAAADFGLHLGIAFQMVDDALDFSPASRTGKPCGGDLREGKITPPLLLYLNSLPREEQAAFRTAFRDNALGAEELDAVTAAVFSRGFARRTRSLADSHLEKARAALALFPAGDGRLLLEKVVDFVRDREL
ncbi:MAG: polyprenyl synthetase family protein [Desulfovibrio sp.]|jgi:octaprenyl-diphosphate synthase|nr:polyprenyl synthetase family protein [Desulfovibrio sp.]